MKKYILAYQISGQTVGIDLHSWSDSDLNGNKAFKIIRSGDTTPSGYIDISSIVNWDIFGEVIANDYLVVRYEIKDISKTKGWANLSNIEKDLLIKHYVTYTPMEAVIYLMTTKGMTQQQAQGFILTSWHKFHAKLLESCNERFYFMKFVVPQYLSLSDCEKLFDNCHDLIYELTELGRFGIEMDDKKSGILDYLMSTNDFVGKGMEESGVALTQGTWNEFRSALHNILIEGIYTKY